MRRSSMFWTFSFSMATMSPPSSFSTNRWLPGLGGCTCTGRIHGFLLFVKVDTKQKKMQVGLKMGMMHIYIYIYICSFVLLQIVGFV